MLVLSSLPIPDALHRVFQTGSPRNVPAGHSVNLYKLNAHYRQQHLDEEERKARELAARSNTGE
jgi:hypothetical protein